MTTLEHGVAFEGERVGGRRAKNATMYQKRAIVGGPGTKQGRNLYEVCTRVRLSWNQITGACHTRWRGNKRGKRSLANAKCLPRGDAPILWDALEEERRESSLA